MSQSCIFCGIVAGDIPRYTVGETGEAVAFLDIGQLTRGHTLVVPKAHTLDLLDPSGAGALTAIAPLVESTARLLDSRLSPAGLNMFQSSRAYAGQEVFHLHVHLVPRYEDDGGFVSVMTPKHDEPDHAALAELLREITGAESP